MFIFSLNFPCKHLLNVTIDPQPDDISQHNIDSARLQNVLSETIDDLPEGKLCQINSKIPNIMILLWDFKHFTPCSSAQYENFPCVNEVDRSFQFPKPLLDGSICLPFFTLGKKDNEIFHDRNNLILKSLFKFSEVTE